MGLRLELTCRDFANHLGRTVGRRDALVSIEIQSGKRRLVDMISEHRTTNGEVD